MTALNLTQPPFDVLSPAQRESLKKHSKVHYLAKDDELDDTLLNYFYVMLKGRVQQTVNEDFVRDFGVTEHSNDWFDARKHPTYTQTPATQTPATQTTTNQTTTNQTTTNQTTTGYQYTASEDALLLQIEGDAIDRLSAQNHHIRNLLSDDLAERMQMLKKHHNRIPSSSTASAIKSNQAEAQQLMLQPVTRINLLDTVIVDEDTTLYDAANTMVQAGIKHVLVRRASAAERHPTKAHLTNLGMLTDTDISRAVSQRKDMDTTYCKDFAKFKLRTIDAHQDISDALMMMIRYRIHRLPVLDESNTVIGILTQSNLLAYISSHSQLISVQIEQASNIDMLKASVEQIGQYIRAQYDNGIKIGVISRMVQALNAQVFTKLWRLIVPDMVFENTCIIVMGSEGRGEQIMRTDQDNALIVRNGFSHPELEAYAVQFNQTLASMGYPLCDGNIMMTNPMWRKSLNRFKSQISQWFAQQNPEHGIWLSAVLDASYVCGDERLLNSLRDHLKIAYSQADPMFVRSFAQAALQFGDINQWWQKFVPFKGKSTSHDIDLKKAGIFPLVHGIRAMALEKDIFDVTSSKARLKALVAEGVFNKQRAETLNEALEFFMARRLDVALVNDDKFARQVDPATLTALERDLLKECLNVVKSFKNELRQHYQLEIT